MCLSQFRNRKKNDPLASFPFLFYLMLVEVHLIFPDNVQNVRILYLYCNVMYINKCQIYTQKGKDIGHFVELFAGYIHRGLCLNRLDVLWTHRTFYRCTEQIFICTMLIFIQLFNAPIAVQCNKKCNIIFSVCDAFLK